ncbi:MAG: sulfotransferase domain-containing protein [Hormoscilla sp. GUM202]|nr:sulfotransferase domain-containing protein [Hormoscilla sp. GUM202]
MIRETTKKGIKRSLSFFRYKLERLDSSSSITKFLLYTLERQKNVPKLKTDDVFLVSYPRSGNTWVKTIVAHILYPHDRIYSLNNLNRLVPEINMYESGIDSDNEYSNPRVIKTHSSFPFRQGRQNSALYSQVIYIVRHPFDVIRSFHHYNSYGNPKLTIEETVCSVTMGHNQWGLWGSWQDHVLSWKVAEKNSQMLFIRYEDMRVKTTDYIR